MRKLDLAAHSPDRRWAQLGSRRDRRVRPGRGGLRWARLRRDERRDRIVYGLVGVAAVYAIGSLLTASRRSDMQVAPATAPLTINLETEELK